MTLMRFDNLLTSSQANSALIFLENTIKKLVHTLFDFIGGVGFGLVFGRIPGDFKQAPEKKHFFFIGARSGRLRGFWGSLYLPLGGARGQLEMG